MVGLTAKDTEIKEQWIVEKGPTIFKVVSSLSRVAWVIKVLMPKLILITSIVVLIR